MPTVWPVAVRPARNELQPPTKECRIETCKTDMKGIKSATEGLNFHSLRHSFITHMVERGVPLGTIQAFVGHMSARMLAHYTHISTGASRRAVELLDAEPMLSPSTLSGAVAVAAEEPINQHIN